MERIAEMIVEIYKGGNPEEIKRRATKLRKSFNKLLYV